VSETTDWLTFDGPVACVLRVRGALSPHLAGRLGGLRITAAGRPGGDGAVTSELHGVLRGQAALHAVLTTLHGLGYALLDVACAPAGRPYPLPARTPWRGRRVAAARIVPFVEAARRLPWM
jgi:hypothetical protein